MDWQSRIIGDGEELPENYVMIVWPNYALKVKALAELGLQPDTVVIDAARWEAIAESVCKGGERAEDAETESQKG